MGKEGRKERNVLFNDALNTFYLRLYGVSHMVKDHSDSEKGDRQDNTYHGLCYTSRGALTGTRNSSMGPPHGGSIRRPIAPWANAVTMELHLAPGKREVIWLSRGAIQVIIIIIIIIIIYIHSTPLFF